MTSEEHNKFIGIGHLIYGGIQTLIFLAVMLFMMGILAFGGTEAFLFGSVIALFVGVIGLLFTLPSFIAGYGLLKHKRWARIAGIIASVLAAMNVPHGTALCIYSLWFMFSEKGTRFYEQTANAPQPRCGALPGTPYSADASWNSATNREREYVPPSQPHDWR
jgi:hypothetical protein